MVWTKNPDLETKMMILERKSLIIRNGSFDQKFLTREKKCIFRAKNSIFSHVIIFDKKCGYFDLKFTSGLARLSKF